MDHGLEPVPGSTHRYTPCDLGHQRLVAARDAAHPKTSTQPHHAATASSRYTPKATKRQLVPPHWIPIIMIVLLVAGGLMIMARYLVWTESNIPTLIGLGCILGGLYTATKWR